MPVTAVEQPVGRILDKSGRGFHATQTTATSRPVLRQDGNGKHYLYFDGVDDFLVTPTITPGIDKVQVFAGVRRLTDTIGIICEFSSNFNNNSGSFLFLGGANADGTGPGFASASRGGARQHGPLWVFGRSVCSARDGCRCSTARHSG